MKFAVTSVSIRVLVQISFTCTYNKRNVAKYSVTARVYFQYLFTNIQIFLYLFEDLLKDIFIDLVEESSSFLLLIS